MSSGQMLFNDFANKTVSVEFASGPTRTFPCSESSTNDPDMLFIDHEASFIKALKPSKRVVIKPDFYQAGGRQFTFNTAGLVWK